VPEAIYQAFTGDNDHDFTLLMDFFCNRWPGRSGNLHGCRVEIMPGNMEAYQVFSMLQGSWNYHPSGKPVGIRMNDIMKAIEYVGAKYPDDCFDRVQFLIGQLMKG